MALELLRPSRLICESPFRDRDLRQIERDMDRYFEDFASTIMRPMQTMRTMGDVCYTPACDMEETANHYLVSFDLPGISKDEIKVELVGNQLCVSGERKRETKEEKKGYYRAEREYGKCQRVIALPTEVNGDKVEANFQDGVLRIALPKTEAAKAKSHHIKIGEPKSGWWDKLIGRGEQTIREIPLAKSAA